MGDRFNSIISDLAWDTAVPCPYNNYLLPRLCLAYRGFTGGTAWGRGIIFRDSSFALRFSTSSIICCNSFFFWLANRVAATVVTPPAAVAIAPSPTLFGRER